MGRDNGEVFGIGEDYGLDYLDKISIRGWQRWRASGYRYFPTYEEIAMSDPDWESDLLLIEEIYRWTHREPRK